MPESGNLPVPVSTFIGRGRENAEVKQLISAHRLVTLTGAGGSGKTRLALRVATELQGEYEDGVWLVELAPLSDPALLTPTVASSLDVREQAGRPLLDVLSDHLLPRSVLLILDNCEHLIHECAQLAERLLQRCPHLRILATSRESLGIAGEAAWLIPPLMLPPVQPWRSPASAQKALEVYGQSEAVQLFIDRATATAQDFALSTENGAWVSEICRRLDGMPLAIELAAARVRTLSVQQIAQRLDDRFHLLVRGSRTAEPRQQTLEAALDWSYTLLSDAERKVLQRLSVFAGGATLDAVEAVCGGEDVRSQEVLAVLSRLVEKSLVVVDNIGDGERRYHLLETIRQYALEKLELSGTADETRSRHLDHFVEWSERAEPHLEGRDLVKWLNICELEHDNFRVALGWSRTVHDKTELGLRLAAALAIFWDARGYGSEGREYIVALLSRDDPPGRTLARAKALYRLAGFAFNQTDYPVSRAAAEESVSIYRELGRAGQLGLANSLITLGDVWRSQGDYEKADSLLNEGLELMRALQDIRGTARALWQLGYSALSSGDYVRAERYFEEALPVCRQSGDDLFTAIILTGWAEAAIRQGDYERAAKLEEESLLLRRKAGEKWGIATSLGSFGWIALRQHDLERAVALLTESLAIRREVDDRGGIAWCLEKMAKVNILSGHKKSSTPALEQLRRAVRLFGAAAALRAPFGSVIDRADQPEYESDIESLQMELGQEAFATLWEEGASLPLDAILEDILAAPEASRSDSPKDEKEKYGGLTGREREVAALIAQGKSNRDIAEAMTVGAKTVETYVTRILGKLGFDSRVQIATWAVEKGLGKKEPE